MKSIVVAVSGASGSIYAKCLIRELVSIKGDIDISLIFSDTAISIWKEELGEDPLSIASSYNLTIFDNSNFHSPFASGSTPADAMIIIPCSMGSVGRIASSLSLDLIGRIADVQLKEGKKLIIVPREAPLHSIHLKNLLTLSECGATIFPATPPFYNHPCSIEDMATMFAHRIITFLDLPPQGKEYQWHCPPLK